MKDFRKKKTRPERFAVCICFRACAWRRQSRGCDMASDASPRAQHHAACAQCMACRPNLCNGPCISRNWSSPRLQARTERNTTTTSPSSHTPRTPGVSWQHFVRRCGYAAQCMLRPIACWTLHTPLVSYVPQGEPPPNVLRRCSKCVDNAGHAHEVQQ